MHYVYLIRSLSFPKERYIGSTSDLKARLAAHNRGDSTHTSKYVPWALEAYIAYKNQADALAMEKYLKTGSGQAFANKRFWAQDHA